jgi:hypothetical protein
MLRFAHSMSLPPDRPAQMNKSYGRLVAWLFGTTGLLTVVAGLVLTGRACESVSLAPCDDEIIGTFPAPAGKANVVVYVRNCGATSSYETHAILTSGDVTSKTDANPVFVADGNRGAAPVGIGNGPQVRVRWISDVVVVLSHHSKARISRALENRDGISIRYATFQ